MLTAPRRSSCALLWPIVAALALSAPAGCARWNWRGEGFGDNSGRWAQKMRPPADEKQFSGLDSRAREVERDLGVH
jgi:hypothetical protein